MKLKFDSNLDYQKEAVSSIVDIFKGQSIAQANFTVSSKIDEAGTRGMLLINLGVGNKHELDNEDLLKNIQMIQLKTSLELSKRNNNR